MGTEAVTTFEKLDRDLEALCKSVELGRDTMLLGLGRIVMLAERPVGVYASSINHALAVQFVDEGLVAAKVTYAIQGTEVVTVVSSEQPQQSLSMSHLARALGSEALGDEAVDSAALERHEYSSDIIAVSPDEITVLDAFLRHKDNMFASFIPLGDPGQKMSGMHIMIRPDNLATYS